ncbi:hypothetical protein BgiBS90_025360 [Biomphalaria glabrata]|nr:hypothetical protein BgiBS90_025360 [Biomphalaria glabrata]
MYCKKQETNFVERLRVFPCTFHLDFKHVKKFRLKERKKRLELETNNSKPEDPRKMNLLLWIYHKLDEREKASELGERLSQSENIISLANTAYIMHWYKKVSRALQCLSTLEKLKSGSSYDSLKTQATLELAFAYKKIGGPMNLSQAIQLYTEYLQAKPEDWNAKLELGITCRRSLHPKIANSEFLNQAAFLERMEKTADVLFSVADSDPNTVNRGRAYIELAVLRAHFQAYLEFNTCHPIFRSMSVKKLCDLALEFSNDDSRVLCECGRIIHRFDWNKAIQVLEKSTHLMPHTVAYHHLAIAYGKRARRMQTDQLGLRWKSISHDPKSVFLDFASVDVQKAIECYRKGVEISLKDNIPAMFNYGQFLKSCGLFEDAIEQFSEVIRIAQYLSKDNVNSEDAEHANIVSAYEQIGLCYLAMYYIADDQCTPSEVFARIFCSIREYEANEAIVTDSEVDLEHTPKRHIIYNSDSPREVKYEQTFLKSCESQTSPEVDSLCNSLKTWSVTDKENLKEMAIENFMTAIVQAASYISKSPHLYTINIWKAYLQVSTYCTKNNPHEKRLFQLLDICGQHQNVFKLTEDLRLHDTEKFKDPDIFDRAIQSYLTLRKYTMALAFLNLFLPQAEFLDTADKVTLQIKVNLYSAAASLQLKDTNPSDLFHHVLDLQFQSTVEACDPNNTAQTDYLDLLILYDDTDPAEEGQMSVVEAKSRELKRLLKTTYNLKVKCNRDRSPCGLRLDPEEMLWYRCIIVVLDLKTQATSIETRVFDATLSYIPQLKIHCEKNKLPLPTVTLALMSSDVPVPLMVQQYTQVYLDDVIKAVSGIPCDTLESHVPHSPKDMPSGLSPVSNYVPSYKRNPFFEEDSGTDGPGFSPKVMAQMRLFCQLLNRTWPSCDMIQRN